MKNTYFNLVNAKKLLLKQKDFFFEQHNDLVFTEDNEVAMKYIEVQEEVISNELKRVNAQLKEIREATSEADLRAWSEEFKARA